jgi:hypothetical protein
MIAPEWPFRRPSRSPITLEIGRNSRWFDALKYHSILQLRVVRVFLPHGMARTGSFLRHHANLAHAYSIFLSSRRSPIT